MLYIDVEAHTRSMDARDQNGKRCDDNGFIKSVIGAFGFVVRLILSKLQKDLDELKLNPKEGGEARGRLKLILSIGGFFIFVALTSVLEGFWGEVGKEAAVNTVTRPVSKKTRSNDTQKDLAVLKTNLAEVPTVVQPINNQVAAPSISDESTKNVTQIINIQFPDGFDSRPSVFESLSHLGKTNGSTLDGAVEPIFATEDNRTIQENQPSPEEKKAARGSKPQISLVAASPTSVSTSSVESNSWLNAHLFPIEPQLTNHPTILSLSVNATSSRLIFAFISFIEAPDESAVRTNLINTVLASEQSAGSNMVSLLVCQKGLYLFRCKHYVSAQKLLEEAITTCATNDWARYLLLRVIDKRMSRLFDRSDDRRSNSEGLLRKLRELNDRSKTLKKELKDKGFPPVGASLDIDRIEIWFRTMEHLSPRKQKGRQMVSLGGEKPIIVSVPTSDSSKNEYKLQTAGNEQGSGVHRSAASAIFEEDNNEFPHITPSASTPAGISAGNVGFVGAGKWPALEFGRGQDIHVVNRLAYMANWVAGLQIFDVSNPVRPVWLGGLKTSSGAAQGIHVVGNVAYVADYSGLRLIDVRDPTTPVVLGGFDTTGEANGVQVVDDIAYLADRSAGLQIIDVGDPANPQLVGSYDTLGDAKRVHILNDIVYVADGEAGLQLIDVRIASNPIWLGAYDTSGLAEDVHVSGNFAYVADGSDGLQIIDVTSPENPVRLGNYDTSGSAWGVQVIGSRAYVADSYTGIHVIDVSNPIAPIRLGGYDTSGWALGIQVAGNHAYVADWDSVLQVIDLSRPDDPRRLGGFQYSGWALGVEVKDNLAYLANGNAGLEVIDVSNPANLVHLKRFDTPGSAYDVRVSGDLAYLADYSAGLQIFDVSDPSDPTLLGSYDTPGFANGVHVEGGVAYVADGVAGLELIDVRNPAGPSRLGGIDTLGIAKDVQVVGNLAFIADGTNGLQIADVSDPTVPELRGSYVGGGDVQAVHAIGGLAYLADSVQGFQVIDTSNPDSPERLGVLENTSNIYSVRVSGNTAFVTLRNTGLRVIDVSDPSNPVLLKGYETAGNAEAVYVANNRAFVADGHEGLAVFEAIGTGVPAITGPPVDLVVPAGSPAILNSSAMGQEPVVYQWSQNGSPLAGETNRILQIRFTQETNAGVYTVSASNVLGTVTSESAMLNVLTAPTIQQQPANQIVTIGGHASLDSDAQGGIPLGFQWRKYGIPIAGATNSSLTLTNIQFSDQGEYSVVVTNASGSVTSSTASLTLPITQFANVGGGRVIANPEQSHYARGEQISLTAINDRYHEFSHWISNGVALAAAPNLTITVAATNRFQAVFTNSLPLEWQHGKQWERVFGGSGSDYIAATLATPDGGWILGGSSDSSISDNKMLDGHGGQDYWLIKLDGYGEKQWERVFGGATDDRLVDVEFTQDGGYLLLGRSESIADTGNKTAVNRGGFDVWVVKTDGSGNKQWDQSYGGGGSEETREIFPLRDGGFLLGCNSASSPGGNKEAVQFGGEDGWLVNIDSQGVKRWDASYGGTGPDGIAAIVERPQGGHLLALYSWSGTGTPGNRTAPNPFTGTSDYWMVVVGDEGVIHSQTRFAGNHNDLPRDIRGTPDGGYIIGGYAWTMSFGVDRSEPRYGERDFWVVKADNALNKEWDRSYGGSGIDVISSILRTSDGGYLMDGYSTSGDNGNHRLENFGEQDIWLVKISPEGGIDWQAGLGGSDNDSVGLQALAQDSDGGILVAGSSQSDISDNKSLPRLDNGEADAWVVKYRSLQVPMGTPQILIDESFYPDGTVTFDSTNTPTVSMNTTFASGSIRYTLDGSTPSESSLLYAGPITITNSIAIQAIAYDTNGVASGAASRVNMNVIYQQIHLLAQGAGSLTVTPQKERYDLGEQVVISAMPGPHHDFSHWLSNGVNLTAASNLPITVGATNRFQVIFTNTVPLEWQIGKEWDRSYGGDGNDYLQVVRAHPDGGWLLAGMSDSEPSGTKSVDRIGGLDFWLLKVDSNGAQEWERVYGGTGAESLTDMRITADGGIILAGYTDSPMDANKSSEAFGGIDAWVIKTDSSGIKQWEQSLGGGRDDRAISIIELDDGGYLMGGYSTSLASGNKESEHIGSEDGWLVRLDTDGTKLWDRSLGGTDIENIQSVVERSNGGFYVLLSSRSDTTGNKGTSNPFAGTADFWLLAIDELGNKLWERRYAGNHDDIGAQLLILPDGELLVGGYSLHLSSGHEKTGPNYGERDYWMIRADAAGTKIWDRTYGGNGIDIFKSAALSDVGGMLFFGDSTSGQNGNRTVASVGEKDYWLIQTDGDGTPQWQVGYGGLKNDVATEAVLTDGNGGILLGGYSDSVPAGDKTAIHHGGADYWLVKHRAHQVPIGTPQILVEESFSPGGDFTFDSTNAPTVTMTTTFANGSIRYTLDGSTPTESSPLYAGPFSVTNSSAIQAIAYDTNGVASGAAGRVNVNILYQRIHLLAQGAGSMTITPQKEKYDLGEQVVISAVPGPYHDFSHWLSNGITIGTETNLNIVVGKTNIFRAVFAETEALERIVEKQGEMVLGGSGDDTVRAAELLPHGGFILGGSSASASSPFKEAPLIGGYDYWLLTFDADGNKLWERTYGGSGADQLTDVAVLRDGGFLLGGYSTSDAGFDKSENGFGGNDYWIVRTDSAGDVVWDRTFGGTSGDECTRVMQTDDGGFLVAGGTSSSKSGNKDEALQTTRDIWMVRLSPSGTKLWEYEYGYSDNANAMGDMYQTDRGFIIGATLDRAPIEGETGWLALMGHDGRIAQSVLCLQPFNTTVAVPMPNGGTVLGGYRASKFGGTGQYYWLTHVNPDFSCGPSHAQNGIYQDQLRDLIRLPDGGFLAGGYSESPVVGGYGKDSPLIGQTDYWPVKFDANFNKEWELGLGGALSENLHRVLELPDGTILLVGRSNSPKSPPHKRAEHLGGYDGWIVKVAQTQVPEGMPRVMVYGEYVSENGNAVTDTNVVKVEMTTTFPNGLIFYTLDGAEPTIGSTVYAGEFFITNNAAATNRIRAMAFSVESKQVHSDLLTIRNTLSTMPPTITSEPLDTTLLVGETLSLSVDAIGAEPFSYQWRYNGIDLPNRTTATINLRNAQPGHVGNYDVVITNAFGAVTSQVATVSMGIGGDGSHLQSIVWTESVAKRIKSIGPDGTNVTTLVDTGGSAPRGIVVDQSVGKMYWVEHEASAIFCADLDGSDKRQIASSAAQPYGLALDAVNGKLYYTTTFVVDSVRRVDLDGANTEILIETVTNGARGIALDVARDKMYWTDGGVIMRADLDGTSPEVVIDTAAHSLALDLVDGRIYWTESPTGSIKRANLDGTGVEALITTGLVNPHGIELDLPAGKMYWVDSLNTEPTDDNLKRANLDGSEVETLVSSPFSQMIDLALLFAEPAIIAQSESLVVANGASITLNVVAGGQPSLRYQWQKDGVNIAAGTNSTMTINPFLLTSNGVYRAIVSNSYGSITSRVMRVEVATIRWTGAAGNQQWNTAGNWDLNHVPDQDDNILVDVPAESMVQLPASDVVVARLFSREGLSISAGRKLEVTGPGSVISGPLVMADGAILWAHGVDASLRVVGPAAIDRSTLKALAGGRLEILTPESYNGGNNLRLELEANGEGSVLRLPALRTVAGNTEAANHVLRLLAFDGGRLDMPMVESISSHAFVWVRGSNSLIDLPKLHTLDGLGNDVTGPLAVWQDGLGVLNMPSLDTIRAVSIKALNGSQLTVPGPVSYMGGNNLNLEFEANGAGSFLSFPSLTNLTGNTAGANRSVRLLAISGGEVRAAKLTDLNRQVTLLSQGTGSVVRLPSARTMSSDGNHPDVPFTVIMRDTGRIELGTGVVSGIDINIDIKSGGTLATGTLQLDSDSRVEADGTIEGNITVNNPVYVGGVPGTFAVTGNYTQGESAILNMELGGLDSGTQHDQLVIGGTASLEGILNIALINNFNPIGGDRFKIIRAGSQTGNFTSFADSAAFTLAYSETNTVVEAKDIPVIVEQPEAQNLASGDDLLLSVIATGTPLPTYQWRFNGFNLPGQTRPSLDLREVRPGHAGDYDVVLTNDRGSVTSAVAEVLFGWGSPGSTVSRIIWTESIAKRIRSIDSASTNNTELLSTSGSAPRTIAVDQIGGKMYWVEHEASAIFKANLDGSGKEQVASSVGQPFGIALDITNKKIYYTTTFVVNSLRRVGFDGSNPEVLVDYGTNGGVAVALDVARNKVYWGEGNVIKRGDLDGSSPETVVSNGVNGLFSIDLDLVHGKIYWTEYIGSTSHAVKRANLDGSNVETLIADGLVHPHDIELDIPAGKMYWADSGTEDIKRANLDGSGVEVIIPHTAGGMVGLALLRDGPAIIAQTHSQVVLSNTPVDLSLVAGGASLLYQWSKDGSPILNATNSTLTFNGFQPADNGVYRVVVTNDFGSVTSAVMRVDIATITWSGMAGDFRWGTEGNWDQSRLPGASDKVLIDVPGDVTVTNRLGTTTIQRLQCENGLELRNALLSVTGHSVINGPLTTGADYPQISDLRVESAGASMLVNGEADMTHTSIKAIGDAALLEIRQLGTYSGGSAGQVRFEARGVGATVSLPGLTNLFGGSGKADRTVSLLAWRGGRIEARRLERLARGFVVQAQHLGSGIDFRSLKVIDLEPQTANGGVLLEINGGAELILDSVEELDGVSLQVFNSGRLNLPLVRSYQGRHNLNNHFDAIGQGCEILLPGLTNLLGSRGTGQFRLLARDGGRIDLSAAPDLTDRFRVTANGTGSLVDLRSASRTLVVANAFERDWITFDVSNGGTIRLDSLTEASTSGFSATGGSELSLPQLRTISSSLANNVHAIGAGSRIDFLALTNLAAPGASTVSVNASDGGELNFPQLQQILGTVEVRIGTNGVILGSAAGVEILAPLDLAAPSARFVGNIDRINSLAGVGTVEGHVIAVGNVDPAGGALGNLSITGNYLQDSASSLNIQLGGLIGGVSYDRLTVGGTVTFAGTLGLSLTNGFNPTNGNEFDVIRFASRTGDFATVSGAGQLLVSHGPTNSLLGFAAAPTISVNPRSQRVTENDPVLLSVEARGFPRPFYQWLKDGAVISDQTNTTLDLGVVQTNATADYSVVVSNTQGVVTSAVANVEVAYPELTVRGSATEIIAPAFSSKHDANRPVDGCYSVDGQFVYVVRDDGVSKVTVYRRDFAGGGLIFVEEITNGDDSFGKTVMGLGSVSDAVVSTDNRFLYTAGKDDNAVGIFERDLITGELRYVEKIAVPTGPRGIDVSLDGRHLYVACGTAGAVTVLDRNLQTGLLTSIGTNSSPATNLVALSKIRVSPDGRNAYVTATTSKTVVVFDRNEESGLLTFNQAVVENGPDDVGTTVTVLDAPTRLDVSPDGKNVYVATSTDDALIVFGRSKTTGRLTLLDAVTQTSGGSFDRPQGVAVSPEGNRVYVTTVDSSSLTVFQRHPVSGLLTYETQLVDQQGAVSGIGGAYDVLASPDGSQVVVLGFVANKVTTFDAGLGPVISNGDLTPDSVDGTDFGLGQTNLAGPVRRFSLFNEGTTNLTVSAINLPDGFNLVGTAPTNISAGATESVTIRMSPATNSIRAGQVVIESNDRDENPFSFAIRGEVVRPPRLFVAKEGSGAIEVAPRKDTYVLDEQVTLIASNTPHHGFSHWLADGVFVSSNLTYIHTILTTNSIKAVFTNAQPLEIHLDELGQHVFGGIGSDLMQDMAVATDGSVYLFGDSSSGSETSKPSAPIGNGDIWVNKVDRTGEVIWEKTYGTSQTDYHAKGIATSDGGALLFANSTPGSRSGFDALVIKIRPDGEVDWQVIYGGSDEDRVMDALELPGGDFLIAGSSKSAPGPDKDAPHHGDFDMWLIRLRPDGSKVWDKSYGGVGEDAIRDIVYRFGQVLICGISASASGSGDRTARHYGDRDLWLVTIDLDGNIVSQASLGGDGEDEVWEAAVTADGGVVLAGNSSSGVSETRSVTSAGDSDMWIIKLDVHLSVEWQRGFGGDGREIVPVVQPLPDGRYLVACASESGASGNKGLDTEGGYDTWLLLLDSDGNKLQERVFGGERTESYEASVSSSLDLLRVEDDTIWLGTFSDSPQGGTKTVERIGTNDMWLVRLKLSEIPEGAPRILLNGLVAEAGKHTFVRPSAVVVDVVTTKDLPGESKIILISLDGSHPTGGSRFKDLLTITNSAVVQAVMVDVDFQNPIYSEVVRIEFLSEFAITNTTLGGGTATVEPSQPPYLQGDSLSLTAVASNGWQFGHWLVRGASNSFLLSNPVENLEIQDNYEVRAVFTTTLEYKSTPGRGEITNSPPGLTQAYGTPLTISAVPADGFYLDEWFGGLVSGSQTPITYTVTNANPKFEAFFEGVPDGEFSLVLTVSGPGIARSDRPSNHIPAGTTVTVTATPAPGQHFVRWEGDLSGSENSVSFVMNRSMKVRAIFDTRIAPMIVSQPESSTNRIGDDALLSVNATGSSPLFYHWRRNGEVLNAPSSRSLRLSELTGLNAGSYDVVVSNELGVAVSQSAQVHVLDVGRLHEEVGFGTDGPVNAVAVWNEKLVVGGNFSSFAPVLGGAGIMRTNGAVELNWRRYPGDITATVSDGNGGFYLACEHANTHRIEHVNPDGTWDADFSVHVASAVSTMIFVDGVLWVGGGFHGIQGHSDFKFVAKLDGTTGALDESWKPEIGGLVHALAVAPEDNAIFVGGLFDNKNLAKLDMDAGDPISGFGAHPDNLVNALVVTNGVLYVGGDFTTIGGRPENGLAALLADSGAPRPGWTANVTPITGASVKALSIIGETLFVGGFFPNATDHSGYPEPDEKRSNLAAFDLNSGQLLSWAPATDGPVRAMCSVEDVLYIGGDFTRIEDQERNQVGAVKAFAAADYLTAWHPNVDGFVHSLSCYQDRVLVGGTFERFARQFRTNLFALDLSIGFATSWKPDPDAPVNALTTLTGDLYVGGQFDQISGTERSYAAKYELGTGDPMLSFWESGSEDFVLALVAEGENVFLGGRSELRAVDVGTGGMHWRLPLADGSVHALCLQGERLAVGGFFELPGPVANLAILSTLDGEVDAPVPSPDGVVNALATDGDRLYLGGRFAKIGDVESPGAGALRLATLQLDSWRPALRFGNKRTVNSITVDRDRIYLGGDFAFGSGTATRFAVVDSTGDSLMDTGVHLGRYSGSVVNAIAVHAGNAFVGGDFRHAGESDAGSLDIASHLAWIGLAGPPRSAASAQSIDRTAGDRLTLKSEVSGEAPVIVRWFLNGNEIDGEFGDRLIVDTLGKQHEGVYSYIASNALGSLTNTVATVTVEPAPAPPVLAPEYRRKPGESLVLLAQVEESLKVSWMRNDVLIPWATNRALVFTNLLVADSGKYRYRVHNENQDGGDSDPIDVIVRGTELTFADDLADRVSISGMRGSVGGDNFNATPEPLESAHGRRRGDRSVWFEWTPEVNGPVSFHTLGSGRLTQLAVYTGGDTFNTLHQLVSDERSGPYQSSFVTFAAEAGTRYIIAVDAVRRAGDYLVLNWLQTAGDQAVPIVIDITQGQTLTEDNTSVTFTAQVDGPAQLQWHRFEELLAGETNDTLTVNAAGVNKIGNYRLRATIGDIHVWAQAGALELGPNADVRTLDRFDDLFASPARTPAGIGIETEDVISRGLEIQAGQLASQIIWLDDESASDLHEPIVGGSGLGNTRWLSFTPTASGLVVIDTESAIDPVIAVYSGELLTNLRLEAADRNSLDGRNARLAFQARANETYLLLVDRETRESGIVELNFRMGEKPMFTTQPQHQFLDIGKPTAFSIQVEGNPPPTLQWLFDGKAIPGATNATLTISSQSEADTGAYRVVASNPVDVALSAIAYLSPRPNLSPTNIRIVEDDTELLVESPLETTVEIQVSVDTVKGPWTTISRYLGTGQFEPYKVKKTDGVEVFFLRVRYVR